MSLRPHIAAAATLIVLALAGCATSNDQPSRSEMDRAAKANYPGQLVPVLYAVDGDTLRVRLLEGRRAYVRLVGIDTPEDVRPGYPTECGAEGAAASMRQLAPDGATVLLRPDSVADIRDRYGRILAHAFVKGRQLELAQLRRGWAEVYRYEAQRFDGLPAFEAASATPARPTSASGASATTTSTPPSWAPGWIVAAWPPVRMPALDRP